MSKSSAQPAPDLFGDDALNPVPAAPLAEVHEPRASTGKADGYSAKDIEEILASGTNPEGDNVGGSMAAVVRNTSQLPPADRAAMAAYIKSLPPVK